MRLNHKDIRDLIKEPYLSSGRSYFKNGVVHIVSMSESRVESNVIGSSVYQVTLDPLRKGRK